MCSVVSGRDTLLPPTTKNIPNEPPDIALGVLHPFALLSIPGLPCSHLCNCRQGIDAQQQPALSKQLITGSRCCYCPHFHKVRGRCHALLLHITTQTFFYLRKGAAAPQKSRACPFLHYRYGRDKPLTSLTPILKRAIIGLSPKALPLIFSFLSTSLSEANRIQELPFAFCFAGVRPLRAGSVPAKQKSSPLISSSLLENDYSLQDAREANKHRQLILKYPLLQAVISKPAENLRKRQ
jgi:hypothetical protein